MRKTLRVFAWMIKGVLLLVALAALVMWPLSWAMPTSPSIVGTKIPVSASISGYDLGDDKVHDFILHAACIDGRLCIGRHRGESTGLEAQLARERAKKHGPGWRWFSPSELWFVEDKEWPRSYGPLRWFSTSNAGDYFAVRADVGSAPLWLIALVFGVRAAGHRFMGIFHSHPISEAVPSPIDIRVARPNALLLIHDVCGTDARLWRIVKRGGRKRALEKSFIIERKATASARKTASGRRL
jgi:hypothetical protein